MHEGGEQAVLDQISELQARHPNLEAVGLPSGDLRIHGSVGFSVEHNSHTIEDSYDLRLDIPREYPAGPPFVYETGGKIPDDFGHFMADGRFCLGAPVEVRHRFARHKSLLRFVEELVIPFLFSYSYKRDHGAMPYGERSHGPIGLIEYYNEFFETGPIPTMRLLKCLADNFAPPLMACPCGSDKKLKECHGPRLDEIRPYQPTESFEAELMPMIGLARKAGIGISARRLMPKRIWNKQRRQRKRVKRFQMRGSQALLQHPSRASSTSGAAR